MASSKNNASAENEPTHENRDSIFKHIANKKFDYEYYMKDIKIISDVSFGQRNYHRNLEPMLDELMRKNQATLKAKTAALQPLDQN